MKTLVLGGTQFVGRHIVQALVTAGHRVTIFNRGWPPDHLPPEVQRLRGDRDAGPAGLRDICTKRARARRSWLWRHEDFTIEAIMVSEENTGRVGLFLCAVIRVAGPRDTNRGRAIHGFRSSASRRTSLHAWQETLAAPRPAFGGSETLDTSIRGGSPPPRPVGDRSSTQTGRRPVPHADRSETGPPFSEQRPSAVSRTRAHFAIAPAFS